MPRGRYSIILSAIVGASWACGAPEQARLPVSPVAPTASTSAPTAGTGATSRLSLPPENINGTTAIAFPPRNEPFDFRTRLELKYRDDLHRDTVQSYADIEGSIVWTQEYLRYRLNGCLHTDAIQRVFAQIDGGVVQPGCGAETTTFPPRDQPFDFRLQLEAKYRDGLRRSPSSTYVNIEGDIVWTQEYLRYRVSGCYHEEALEKVFAQIDGRGVQRACAPPAQVINDSVRPLDAQVYTVSPSAAASYEFVLTWSDPSVDLDLLLTAPDCRIDSPTCRVFAGSVSDAGTLERFTFFIRAGETFRLWVFNWAGVPQSFRLDVRAFASTGAADPPPTLERLGRMPAEGNRSRVKTAAP